jgi:hypothetical protein
MLWLTVLFYYKPYKKCLQDKVIENTRISSDSTPFLIFEAVVEVLRLK